MSPELGNFAANALLDNHRGSICGIFDDLNNL